MKRSVINMNWVVIGVVVLAAGVILYLFFKPAVKVSNFEECVAAGGALLESYPERCLYDKQSFVNESQLPNGEAYIGMSEEDALSNADASNIPARVVERDGEGLAVTMDYVYGRYNLYVKDGAVYKVDVEGRETNN